MIIEYPPSLLQQAEDLLKGHHLTGFVAGQGPKHPKIMLIGEAPGRGEAKTGVPFVGASGKELMKLIEEYLHMTREDVYITSVVRRRPYSIKRVKDKKTGAIVEKTPNRTPTKAEVYAYARLFDWELDQVRPKILMPLGNTSLQRLLGPSAKIGSLHGQILHCLIQRAASDHQGYVMSNQSYTVIPMYHPAAFLYARKLEPIVRHDWEAIAQKLDQLETDKI